MSCKHETEWCKNHVHCETCGYYEVGNLTTAINVHDNRVKKLFGYRIFYGLISGVLIDTSWENARDRVREYYKDDKKYLEYWGKEKKLCGEDDVPIIEIYDLSERFEEDINYIFPLVI